MKIFNILIFIFIIYKNTCNNIRIIIKFIIIIFIKRVIKIILKIILKISSKISDFSSATGQDTNVVKIDSFGGKTGDAKSGKL